MNKYLENFKITTYNVDTQNYLNLTDLFKFFQEVASNHASKLNFGYDDLIQKNQFWVLVRSKVIISSLPTLEDVITIETFPKGINRIFAMRDFIVYQNNLPIIKASSVWIIIDKDSEKPLVPNFMKDFKVDYEAIEGMIPKGKSELNYTFHHSKTVRYSDLDINRHMNNTKYIDSVLDTFDCNFFDKYKISEFQIDYLNQAKPHETLSISTSQKKTNIFSIKGDTEEKTIFLAEIKFSNINS